MRPKPFLETVAAGRASPLPGFTRVLGTGLLLAFALSLSTSVGLAQRRPQPESPPDRPMTQVASAISGRVIDAATGSPLNLATVHLEQAGAVHVLVDGDGPSEGRLRTVLTDESGQYRFERVVPGRYRVRIRRAGYRTAVVDVELGTDGGVNVTVGLDVQPVEFSPVQVRGEPVQPYHRASGSGEIHEIARIAVAENRQASYLGSDVRALTASDVRDAVTLAESDIFRALQRLPGVGRRDDYTAVLWTRGAPWAQTRVYFDGMPLYNPTHGGWLFSSVNPDGVGAAYFHPGVRSATWGEGAAGVLDLQSRTGGTDFSARAELSLASARVGADGRLPGNVSWMLAARRTYVDLLTTAWDAIGSGDDSAIPYDFSDVIGRIDIPLLWGAEIQASGIAESDRLRGDIPDVTERNRADWGNRAGRVTLQVPMGPVRLRGTIGGTRFATEVEEVPPTLFDEGIASLPDLSSSVDHDRTSVTLDGGGRSETDLRWSLGFESIREKWVYLGPFTLTGEGIPGLPRTHADLRNDNRYDAWWGEVRVSPLQSLELQGGARLEVGDSVMNGGDRRWSPRFSARWRPIPEVSISAGWGRSFQYTQAIGASAGPIGPQLHLGNQWIIAASGYPALRSDVSTFGIEAWTSDSWLLSANTYLRRSTGIAEPDPTPGQLAVDRNNYVPATNVARGLELSARRLAGRWTIAAGYAFGDSEMRAVDLRFPGSAEIRHSLDVTSSYRVDDRLRLGAALSLTSGAPYTRIVIADPPRLEDPYAQRTSAYVGLDLLLDYSTRIGGFDANVYLQLINALNRRNAITYAGSREVCRGGGPLADPSGCQLVDVEDDFTAGLPILPLIGVRIEL